MNKTGVSYRRIICLLVVFALCITCFEPNTRVLGQLESEIVVWANDGGDKVTQDDLRASSDSSAVLNSVWDGEAISIFGARNEVVAFNLILEAPGSDVDDVEVQFNRLDGPNGASITSRTASGEDVSNFVGRNIELFYVRYLKIEGLSTDLAFAGYNYDQRHIPDRFQLPYNGVSVGDIGPFEGIGTWEDRPDHDKYYPEIAVPLELESPFTIISDTSQSIWGDIYIPKTSPSGEYSGTVTVLVDGETVHEIPITLDVRDFMLPDIPTAKTMIWIGHEDINFRYLGDEWPGVYEWDYEYTKDMLRSIEVTNSYHQLAHRHKVSLIEGNEYDESLETPVEVMMWPRLPWLSGSLFTPEEGYEGIGMGIGSNVFSISTYGSFRWEDGTKEDMWSNTTEWVDWFENQDLGTPTEYFLYLIDETDDYPLLEKWASWMDSNPGSGKKMPSMATIRLTHSLELTPSLDIPTSAGGYWCNKPWQEAYDTITSMPDKKFWMYNGQRPGTGTFATEDDGISPRVIAWTQYKMDIERWFYWAADYYHNYQGGEGHTNLFQTAQVYGSYNRDDEQLGKTGWNYFNGDGVLMYPGTDTRYPADSYNVTVPFASLRLKQWRRGIQDHDYLTLAAEIDPERVNEIVEELIPVVLWEVGCAGEGTDWDDSWVYSDVSWSNDPDLWEAARKELADIIENGVIDTDGDGLDDRDDPDDDNDEILDVWEFENHFNHLYDGDAASDADKDGVTNLQEYLAGTNPREQIEKPETVPEPEPEPEENDDEEMDDDTNENETLTEELGRISILVFDADGSPINDATISSTNQPAGESTFNAFTGFDGEVMFDELPAGSYTFIIIKTGYESTTVSGGITLDENLTLTVFLEQKTEESINESGIPSFPSTSVIIGLTLILFYIWWKER
jgi:hypothetical protein